MELGSTALTTAVQEIVKTGFGFLSKFEQNEDQLTTELQAHLSEVEAWSSVVQVFGMTSPMETQGSTVPLKISTEPRRFRNTTSNKDSATEEDVLRSSRSSIILGDPGAGKTTTLKRLARLVLTNESIGVGDYFQYPLLIRLKDTSNKSLWVRLAEAIGIRFTWKQIGPLKTVGRYMCADAFLENVVMEYVDKTHPIILVDGLDEVSSNEKIIIEQELVSLNNRTRDTKIIVSCRSGDFNKTLEGFDILEIQPLLPEQISEIANKWIAEPKDFLTELENSGCADLSDRPLFLINLIILFKRTGYLPEQSVDTVERMLILLIKDWDEQRSIRRVSKYSKFTPEKKLRFLAALSLLLTYEVKSKRFWHSDFFAAYNDICESFGLPHDEADTVAREIEGHTGVIIDVGHNQFEFCHLSIQEFLAAHHMVREPFSEYVGKYMASYSAPVALAVCISSDPSVWFASVVLNAPNWNAYAPNELRIFLQRLIVERPVFTPKVELGLALIKIETLATSKSDEMLADVISEFLQNPSCSTSVGKALEWYSIEQGRSSDIHRLTRKFHLNNRSALETPESGLIRNSVLNCVSQQQS